MAEISITYDVGDVKQHITRGAAGEKIPEIINFLRHLPEDRGYHALKQQLAYQRFVLRGHKHGHHLQDWYDAEYMADERTRQFINDQLKKIASELRLAYWDVEMTFTVTLGGRKYGYGAPTLLSAMKKMGVQRIIDHLEFVYQKYGNSNRVEQVAATKKEEPKPVSPQEVDADDYKDFPVSHA